MEYKFLDNLSIDELNDLKQLVSLDETSKRCFIEQLDRKILHKKEAEISFSSDRMSHYCDENKEKCIKLLDEFIINDLSFLANSLMSPVNRHNFFPFDKIINGKIKRFNLSITDLSDFFDNPNNIYYHEGTYNTYNYVINHIYYLLSINENITKEEIINDWNLKKKLTEENISSIAKYILDIKNGTKLQLSIGNRSLSNIVRFPNAPLNHNKLNVINAVSFGITMEDLENKNYDACKRLLFLPRQK